MKFLARLETLVFVVCFHIVLEFNYCCQSRLLLLDEGLSLLDTSFVSLDKYIVTINHNCVDSQLMLVDSSNYVSNIVSPSGLLSTYGLFLFLH